MEYAEALRIAGRVLLGGLFLAGGIRHFFILPELTPMVAARGVPMARVAVIAASVLQALAGFLVVAGVWILPAAIGLILFTIVASILLLHFWDMDGPAREATRNGFLTNLAVIGGLLITAAEAL
jgi:putative oxidoreductase